MALVIADIYANFSEFDLTDSPVPGPNAAQDALVTKKLAAAEAMTDRTIFASTAIADQAVMYLTAHLLALALPAIVARLQKSRGDQNLYTSDDVYWPTYERLARAATGGLGRTT